MKKVDSWDLAQARMVILAVRLEGLTLGMRPDGSPVVRGGTASPVLLSMLSQHREAVVQIIQRKARMAV